jgi:hypothetical protein
MGVVSGPTQTAPLVADCQERFELHEFCTRAADFPACSQIRRGAGAGRARYALAV